MRICNLKGKLIFDGPIDTLQGANLRGANLQEVDLQRADLQRANLWWANLQGANLRGANLQGANLRGANLQGANLQGTSLQGANLRGASLQRANLRGANLQGANLRGANLQRANLRGADLQGADLQGADLQYANLQGIITDHTTSYFSVQCPEKGSFTGFKKAENDFIVELKVPSSALRSSATSRQCRVSKAKVVSITKGKESITSCPSQYDDNFIYEVGKMMSVKDFNKDRWVECTSGIHLFITREEAESYQSW